ncbi:hypothetical protein BASA81_006733 [Batrachochytrium salamandrivorans]|nr:hypothetical protein BASA81_006733 [Batrachochytrium salamandrivorans]
MLFVALARRRLSSSPSGPVMFEFKEKLVRPPATSQASLTKEEFAKMLAVSKQQAAAKYQEYTDEMVNKKIMKCPNTSKLEFLVTSLPLTKLSAINTSTALLRAGILLEKHPNTQSPELENKLLLALEAHKSAFNTRSMLSIGYGAYKLGNSQLIEFANQLVTNQYVPKPHVVRPRNNPFSKVKGSPDDAPRETTMVLEVLRTVEMLRVYLQDNLELRNTMVDDYLCRLNLKKISASQIATMAKLVVELGNTYGEANGRNAYLQSLKTELFKRKYEGLSESDWDVLLLALKTAEINVDDIFDYYALVISTGHQFVQPEFVEKLMRGLSAAKLEELK